MAHRTDPNFADSDVIVLSSDGEDDVKSGPASNNNRNQNYDEQAAEIEKLKAELAASRQAKEAVDKELANLRNSTDQMLAACLLKNRELEDKIAEAEKVKIRKDLETKEILEDMKTFRDALHAKYPKVFGYSKSSDDNGLQTPGQL